MRSVTGGRVSAPEPTARRAHNQDARLVFDLLFLKDGQKSFRSMHRCPASLCKQPSLIVMFSPHEGSWELMFNPHGPVLYGPANCILKRSTADHSVSPVLNRVVCGEE
jgi:hypothetical protein